ncbi:MULTISPECIES: hypothetical protein [Levilactobacillus]|uniref:hypothetical protein n=1 Tax=Levilactobacillus TaxID=2767886 RepID=UPI0013DE572F|nr:MULTISPECIES: hypothetical protein [Levilactobacillus]
MKKIFLRLQEFFSCFYLRHIKKPQCIICGEVGTLKVGDHQYICESCAEIMNEIGNDRD